ncbi:hypothetical protein ABFX02_02G094600 [Erythranthe guttata]
MMMMMMIEEVMESAQKEEGGLSDTDANNNKKSCSDCKTTKTPLWRSGPSGPKSLCNACGIKHRKRRPAPAEGWKNEVKKGKIGKTRKMIKPLGEKVEIENSEEERSRSMKKKSRRRQSQSQWGEVERAALLLMALSCGAVFA